MKTKQFLNHVVATFSILCLLFLLKTIFGSWFREHGFIIPGWLSLVVGVYFGYLATIAGNLSDKYNRIEGKQ